MTRSESPVISPWIFNPEPITDAELLRSGLGAGVLGVARFDETLGVGVKLCAIGAGVAGAAVTFVGVFCIGFGVVAAGSGKFDACGLVFASVGLRHIIFPQEV
jgi:hypothetical protein